MQFVVIYFPNKKVKNIQKIKEPKQGKLILKFLSEREIEHLRESCFTPMEKALFEFRSRKKRDHKNLF